MLLDPVDERAPKDDIRRPAQRARRLSRTDQAPIGSFWITTS